MWWDAVAGGITGTLGLITSAHAKEQARQQQEAAIRQYQQSLDANNNATLANNLHALYSGTGQVNNGVMGMGKTLGDALAASGTYNSSATASALANAQSQGMGHVIAALQQAELQRQQMLNSGAQNVANMQMGVANQNMNTALGQQQGAYQGVQQFIQGLAQQNLARSGANASSYHAPIGNGNNAGSLPGAGGANPYDAHQSWLNGQNVELRFTPYGGSSWLPPHQQSLYQAFMGR